MVATRVGGVPLLIESETSGLVVEPGNPGCLADATIRALAERRQVPDSERTRVAGPYGIDRLNADLDSLYRSVLGQYAGAGNVTAPLTV